MFGNDPLPYAYCIGDRASIGQYIFNVTPVEFAKLAQEFTVKYHP
jgi:hypothetical protein